MAGEAVKKIGVFTSGGEAPGMNAALCVARMNHGIGFSFQNAVDAQRIFAK